MFLTNDQYIALSKLEKWYRKCNHQIIEIAGVVGTGIWQVIQEFITISDIDMREVMYLSYDQKQVLELAYKRFHAYFINGIIYNYIRLVDFDTIPILNPRSNVVESTWKKKVRKKIDPRYRLIVVFDSMLLDEETIRDLCTFGLPIILIRDPMLTPTSNSYTFLRDPNIVLRELHPDLIRNPITYFANKILNEERLKVGNYDRVSVIPRKQMNLYNLRSSDMNITISEKLRDEVNQLYRERFMKQKTSVNVLNEKVIVMSDMHSHKIVNHDEKKIKVYLTKGMIGRITKLNKHVPGTKYVPIELRPEFYHESFDDLVMDRYYLNKLNGNSRQLIPDETILLEYAYALTPTLARLSHWNKVTLIIDPNEDADHELQIRLLYTAVTRAKESLNIII